MDKIPPSYYLQSYTCLSLCYTTATVTLIIHLHPIIPHVEHSNLVLNSILPFNGLQMFGNVPAPNKQIIQLFGYLSPCRNKVKNKELSKFWLRSLPCLTLTLSTIRYGHASVYFTIIVRHSDAPQPTLTWNWIADINMISFSSGLKRCWDGW